MKSAAACAFMFIAGVAPALALPERPYECDTLEDAAYELESAARDLMRCAQRHDYSDDCTIEQRDVADAADNYENAVSDAAGTFDGQADVICPAPFRIIDGIPVQ